MPPSSPDQVITSLIIATLAAVVSADYQSCGGFRVAPAPRCPKGTACLDDPRIDGCGMACDAPGICIPNKAPQCGGPRKIRCPYGSGLVCYDKPNDDCDPRNGGVKCPGVCLTPLKQEPPAEIPEDAPFCGGIGGLPCPEGLVCIDDPRDGCDPKKGGADCGGVCVSPPY
ncbi:hypothetical protein VDGE_03799 [Verticillium dahliae]|uniref:Uncharacterized protein n=1 Tax=Verticillium dahliae TaxID=27337 RepID=A0A444RUT6_VERDA|nr:hypothetical protein VDGE_03799 [Verticillium dahliae]